MQGLLIINKPKNITSFGVVAAVKRIAQTKRVGHTGTLDPMATGVLPVFVGRATVLSSFLLDADKEYTATMRLGTVTDTDDITGNVIETKSVSVTENEILSALKNFTGNITQVPPNYSAIKQNGVPMYKLARAGKKVDIPPRQVTVYSITPLTNYKNNEITLKIRCSKGTYIRSLCRDIGEYLGCGATLTELCRDYASGFGIENSVPLDNLSPDNIGFYLTDAENAVEYLRKIEVTEKQAVRFLNGGRLDIARLHFTPKSNGEFIRVRFKNKLLGIGRVNTDIGEIEIKCITEEVN